MSFVNLDIIALNLDIMSRIWTCLDVFLELNIIGKPFFLKYVQTWLDILDSLLLRSVYNIMGTSRVLPSMGTWVYRPTIVKLFYNIEPSLDIYLYKYYHINV